MFTEDAYQLLGISPDADPETIKKAYRALARQWHPDVNQSANAVDYFRRITEAFEILMDPAQRLRHDTQFGHNKKVKAKGEQSKFIITEERKAKAQDTVEQWKHDYSVVMQAREAARIKQQEKYQRGLRRARLIIAAFLILLAWLIYWWLSK